MSRDGFEIGKTEPLRVAHARIDALLEEIAHAQPLHVSSDRIDLKSFVAGRAILDGNGAARAETCAAALLRYTTMKRGYTGGIYSSEDYSEHDYCNVVSKIAQTLLRAKLPFEGALLVRVVVEVADYAAENVRTYPIKGLLSQVEQLAKTGLPTAIAPALADLSARLGKDLARYKTTAAPAVVRDSAARVAKLLGKK